MIFPVRFSLIFAIGIKCFVSLGQFTNCTWHSPNGASQSFLESSNSNFILSANSNPEKAIQNFAPGACEPENSYDFGLNEILVVRATLNGYIAGGWNKMDSIPVLLELGPDFNLIATHQVSIDISSGKGRIYNLVRISYGWVLEFLPSDPEDFIPNVIFCNSDFSLDTIIKNDMSGELFSSEGDLYVNNGLRIVRYNANREKTLTINIPPDQDGNMTKPAISYYPMTGIVAKDGYIYTSISLLKVIYQSGSFKSYYDVQLRKYRENGTLVKSYQLEKQGVLYTNSFGVLSNHFLQLQDNKLFLIGNTAAEHGEKDEALFLLATDTDLNPLFFNDTLGRVNKEIGPYGLAIDEQGDIAVLYETYTSPGVPSDFYLMQLFDLEYTSINSTEISNLKIYPNPVLNELNITGPEAQETMVTIQDQLGHTLLEQWLPNNNKLNLAIKPGIYILTINQKDNIYRKRILKL